LQGMHLKLRPCACGCANAFGAPKAWVAAQEQRVHRVIEEQGTARTGWHSQGCIFKESKDRQVQPRVHHQGTARTGRCSQGCISRGQQELTGTARTDSFRWKGSKRTRPDKTRLTRAGTADSAREEAGTRQGTGPGEEDKDRARVLCLH
jgi:hypothetical protein